MSLAGVLESQGQNRSYFWNNADKEYSEIDEKHQLAGKYKIL